MTYFLILGGFLGLGVIGYTLLTRWRVWGQVLLVVGCLGAFTLLARELYLNVFASSTKTPDRYHAVAAYMMGHQVAGEFAGKRGQILVVLPAESAANSEALDALHEAFARVLAAYPALEVKETTLKPAADAPKHSPPSLAAFEEAVATAPNALACVSFAGVPPEVEKVSLFNKDTARALFVYDPTGGTNWVEPLKKRLIHRVIVTRPQALALKSKAVTGSPDEIFQRYFLWATPETADEIAEQLANR